MLEFFLCVAAVTLGVILAFMPWLIHDELKRQGKERRDEALKIISLLVEITGGPRDMKGAANNERGDI